MGAYIFNGGTISIFQNVLISGFGDLQLQLQHHVEYNECQPS